MKEKTLASFFLALSLTTLLTLYASADVAKSASLRARVQSGTTVPQGHFISSGPPQTEWNKTYGGANRDRAYSIVETSDGGYAIIGETSSYGAGYNDFWLVKTDSTGNMLWNQTYGGDGADRAYSVVETSDGGYALAGYTSSFGAGNYDYWLVKTDSAGNVQWNQTYGGADPDIAHSLVQTSDGGYALAGGSLSFGAGSYDYWLVKTDSAGNVQWNQTHGGTNNDIARSVVETSDGGYMLAGETASYGAGNKDFWLVKTDSTGNVQWNQTYGGTDSDIAYSLVETSDAGYAIAGDTRSYGAGRYDFWLVKTDSSGSMQWNITYGGADHDIAYSLVETSDAGYAIAGDTRSYGAGGYDFWLVKTDSTGNVQWNQTHGGTNNDIARSLVQTNDAGYAISGYTASYGAGGEDSWLVKIEAEVHDVATTDVAPSKTVVGQGFTLSINVTVANQGNYSETFNVTAYANTTVIETETITLERENSATITFTWDTTGFAKGNYTISAYSTPVLGEIYTADNTYTDSTIVVTIPGDVTGDRVVDTYDLFITGKAYGSVVGEPAYSPEADITNDGRVDTRDLAVAARNYGKVNP